MKRLSSDKRRLPPLLVLISGLTVGCAGTKETVLPQDGPTMKSIYDQHMVDVQRSDQRRAMGGQPLPQSGFEHYRGFVREAANEIDTVFPRLPNPTLVMYIFPHLSGRERTPVPGYVTTFPFYETVEYALPGEVSGEVSPAPPSTADPTQPDR
ncbi:TIGR03751 family conjugal transfer lipoprotein [Mangrovimicrobium sediminis]|uniref:TIGR03751 family conjugal transfer lipoprotein n=1 Tax=Mangrovimicrobium sediminis TaxID=2562682 RepID=A0A4Z0LY05_9GAMM|nr:TIGR03751 family conjugal transfer lipoprotein [Haliea sp. SAOS-164]TGD72161.1 TIGR03751 family conjugal transfer lipoprotein [Haliea sp. SAOS-164]